MPKPKNLTAYQWLNKNNEAYCIFGFALFVAGILISIFFEEQHDIVTIALSHLLLILGEALMVFFFVNVVLEEQTKSRLRKSVEDVIKAQEAQIIGSFDRVSLDLLNKTTNLFTEINNDIFKAILKERTSPEIAEILSKDDFFKSIFLKTQKEMIYEFSLIEKDGSKISLRQIDEYSIKNISHNKADYGMSLKLTSTSSKTYKIVAAGFKTEYDKTFTNLIPAEDIDIKPIPSIPSGKIYKLKDSISLDHGHSIHLHRTFDTEFKVNPDGLDDFFYSIVYMMPFVLRVTVPDGYEFDIVPTFGQKLDPPDDIGLYKKYSIPFLFPGQGFSFALHKKA